MERNERGQGSFEVILIAVIIIGLSILVLSNFINVFDGTKAAALLKTDAIAKLNEVNGNYFIQQIQFAETGANGEDEINFVLQLNQALPDGIELDFSDTQELIQRNTKYEIVNVEVRP